MSLTRCCLARLRAAGAVGTVFSCLCGSAGEARGQQLVHELSRSSTTYEAFGATATVLGDLDGDGADDFAVGAPRAAFGGVAGASYVAVYSGRDALLLYRILSPSPWVQFAEVLSRVSDVDRDGVPDLAVGVPGDSSIAGRQGSVMLYSGANGVLLRWIPGTTPGETFAGSLASVGDVDGDSSGDLLVGSVGQRCTLVSGGTGAVLWSQASPLSGGLFGRVVGSAGDVDGDGTRDYLVTAPYHASAASYSGMAFVYSGRSPHALLRAFRGQTGGEQFGRTALALGDVDGDGRGDLAFGTVVDRVDVVSGGTGVSLYSLTGLGGAHLGATSDVDADGASDFLLGDTRLVRLVSGRSGAILGTMRFLPSGTLMGPLDGLGDFQRDGLPDVLFSIEASILSRPLEIVRIASWVPAGLEGSPAALSSAAGGVQTLTIGPGSYYANEPYLLLGSLSGTMPGFALGATVVPLNPDAYTTFTLLSPNTSLLAASSGLLNNRGHATAAFRLPRGIPGSVGLQIHHALLFANGAQLLASNATALGITP